MIEPGTGLTILGGAIGGAKVLEKLLGPTSEYIGENLRDWTKKKIENTSRIFMNAKKKLGKDINKDGQVPPRVLKGILEDGSWCEEELQVEYFGGVLASSRTGSSRDDRGAYFNSLISRLTTYQLRTHYLFYQHIKIKFDGESVNINDGTSWRDMELFISNQTYFKAMDFTKDESEQRLNLMSHSIWGLYKEDLIGRMQAGSVDDLRKSFKGVKENGLLFQPSQIGVELFMWAYGVGQKGANSFFDERILFENDQNIFLGESLSTKQETERLKNEEK